MYLLAMEMTEMDGLSIEGSSLPVNADAQCTANCNGHDITGGFTTNLHQSADNVTSLQDIIDKEIVGHSYTNKLCKTVLLICVIVFLMGVMQTPIILYATAPSPEGMSSDLANFVDFKSCSVSYITH